MEIVLQGKELPRYETGHVVSGLLKVPVVGGLRASDVTIALVGKSEVKWCPTENNYLLSMYQLPPIQENRKILELVYEVKDQGMNIW